MRFLAMTAAALALGAAPALAATTGTNAPTGAGTIPYDTTGPGMAPSGITGQNGSGNDTMSTQGHMPSRAIQQRIHHELSQAGFTDIHVMPQSFLVRAKDSSGNPVMMVINPDSVTAITAMQHGPGSSSADSNSSGSPYSGMSSGSSSAMGTNGSGSAMGTSTMRHSAEAGSAINSPNGNGTTVH